MDWKSLIAEIQALGRSQPQIAAECGCGQATISDLVSGKTKDPRHSLGVSLIALRDRLRLEAEPAAAGVASEAAAIAGGEG